MSAEMREQLDKEPEALIENYCPACGELRPVRTPRDAHGAKRHFWAKCKAPLGEEVSGAFDKPGPGIPGA